MWASATSQIKGKEEWGSFIKCCICAQCCPSCTFCVAYKELSAHYGIEEPVWWLKPCLPLLSFYQLFDTILVREKLHMVPIFVAPDDEKPGMQEMD